MKVLLWSHLQNTAEIIRRRVTDLALTLITSTLLFIVRDRLYCILIFFWFLFVVILENKLILSLYKLVSVYWKPCLQDSFTDSLQMTSTTGKLSTLEGRQKLMWNNAISPPPAPHFFYTYRESLVLPSLWFSTL